MAWRPLTSALLRQLGPPAVRHHCRHRLWHRLLPGLAWRNCEMGKAHRCRSRRQNSAPRTPQARCGGNSGHFETWLLARRWSIARSHWRQQNRFAPCLPSSSAGGEGRRFIFHIFGTPSRWRAARCRQRSFLPEQEYWYAPSMPLTPPEITREIASRLLSKSR